MQNLPWKGITIGIMAFAAVLAGVLYFKKAESFSTNTAAINPAFGEYISTYTGGVVNSGSSIQIVLTQDVVDSTGLGETSVKLFSFKPSISGKTV